MQRNQQLYRGIIAGAAVFAVAACSTEGPTQLDLQPAFDTETTRNVTLCKIGLNPLAVGQVITFHYSVDGGVERTTQRTAASEIGGCAGQAALLDNDGDTEIPIGAVISVREELPAGGELVLATATTGFVPGTDQLCPISVDYPNASGTFQVCDAAFPIIFFKNTLEEEETGSEGCTPGYWGRSQHFDSWTGYATTDLVSVVFGIDLTGTIAENWTLLDAVNQQGGGNTIGQLLRHATAGLLNASHPDVDYPYTEAEIIAQVQAAVASGSFEAAKNDFDTANNLGCTLN